MATVPSYSILGQIANLVQLTFEFTSRILGMLMLRRSKDMTLVQSGAPIMEQKKLTVEYVPVAQRPSERALYCFLEYIVSQELQQKNANARDLKSRSLCLRLLKQMCFSAVSVSHSYH